MAGFPLLNPPPHLIERIIAKTDYRSNFRLRRTCHTVSDLIQSSENIVARVRGEYGLQFTKQSLKLLYYSPNMKNMDLKDCYGTRLEFLHLPGGIDEEKYNFLHGMMKKYRITCDNVHLQDDYTAKQYEALFKLLTPATVRFSMECSSFQLFQAIYNIKTVKHIFAEGRDEDAIPAMRALSASLGEVTVEIPYPETDVAELLRTCLEAFLSQNIRNQSFRLYVASDEITSTRILLSKFSDLVWNSNRTHSAVSWAETITADVKLPPHFPPNSSCEILIRSKSSADDELHVDYYILYKRDKPLVL